MCPLSVRTTAPLLASQTFAVLSSLPVTIREPSGLNDAEVTGPVCPLSVRTSAPLRASQTFAVLSSLAGDDPRPVGAERRRIDVIGVPLEREDLGAAPGVPDLRRLVRDSPVTIREPSGLNDAEMTGPVCPLSVRTSAPLLASQTFAVVSPLPVTTREPSGLNDAEQTGPVCPLSVRTSAPLRASQTFAVLSRLPVTIRDPSGLNDAERT